MTGVSLAFYCFVSCRGIQDGWSSKIKYDKFNRTESSFYVNERERVQSIFKVDRHSEMQQNPLTTMEYHSPKAVSIFGGKFSLV